VLRMVLRDWIFAILFIMMTCLEAYIVFKLLNYPVIQFRDNTIEFTNSPVLPPKIIFTSDISSLMIKKGLFGYHKIILKNKKTIHFPISDLQNTDRDLVLSELEKITSDAASNIQCPASVGNGLSGRLI